MKGNEILEALSWIDESYIEEAEREVFPKRRSYARVLLPLAACFCIVFLGLLGLPGPEKGSEMSVSENQITGKPDILLQSGSENPREVPTVILRITGWTETGFTATVEDYVDTDLIPLGETVEVSFGPNICVEIYEGETVTAIRRIPAETDFPAGTLVRVRCATIKDGQILAEAISLAVDN